LVARSQESASRVGEQTGFKTGGLGVVVVTISVSLWNVLEDDSPVTLDIYGPCDLGVVNVGGTKITLRSDPMTGVVLAWSFACSSVVMVVKMLFLRLCDQLYKIIGGLISDIGVLFKEQSVLGDFYGNVVSWVLLIHDTVGEVRTLGAFGWGFGVTIAVSSSVRSGGAMRGWDMMRGRCRVIGSSCMLNMVNWGMVKELVGPYQRGDKHQGACNQF